MRLEDRVVLSVVGLTGDVLNDVTATAEVQVAPLTSTQSEAAVTIELSQHVSQTSLASSATVNSSDSSEPEADSNPPRLAAITQVPQALEAVAQPLANSFPESVQDLLVVVKDTVPVFGNENPKPNPLPNRESPDDKRPVSPVLFAAVDLPLLRVNIGGQDSEPTGNGPVEVLDTAATIIESVPVVGKLASQNSDVLPDPIPDNDLPDEGESIPPDLPVSDLPVPENDGNELPGNGPLDSSTDDSPVNNPSTSPDGSGLQDARVAGNGESGAGFYSSANSFARLDSEVVAANSSQFSQLDDAHHFRDGQSELLTLASSDALDAALTDLFATDPAQGVESLANNDDSDLQAATAAVQDDAGDGELLGENADEDQLDLLRLLANLASGLTPSRLQLAFGLGVFDMTLALEAIDDLLDAMADFGDASGLWAQAGFAICLLSTVAAAGGGCEITRRKIKRDTKLAEADSEDDVLPPDMFSRVTN